MAFTVLSIKSSAENGEDKMSGQERPEVTTVIISAFRHGPHSTRQDESAIGRGLALSHFFSSWTHHPGCGSEKGQWMEWYWFSRGSLCYFRIPDLQDTFNF